jgi:tetrahydromethanopterin S-methyltransferase subunit D
MRAAQRILAIMLVVFVARTVLDAAGLGDNDLAQIAAAAGLTALIVAATLWRRRRTAPQLP